jgi:diguanylate cyclase (GGDEF)-like protein
MHEANGKICDYTILLVDDDLFMRRILEDTLVTQGYSVVTAGNGREALELIEKGDYPLIISDWMMPEMDGLELCRTIRVSKKEQNTYIILLTAQDAKDGIIQGLEAGANEYLVKPVNTAELTVRLKTARRIIDLERSLQKSLEEIRTLSLKDPLTGIFNRRYLNERLPRELKRAYRYERPLSIIMLDIDHFKSVNDRYGHHSGDEVLKACAMTISDSIRIDVDWIARYGGEEFVVFLPETPFEGMLVVAERLRREISEICVRANDVDIRVTASFGAASHMPVQQSVAFSADYFLDQADRCLYHAKQNGRNRVTATRV